MLPIDFLGAKEVAEMFGLKTSAAATKMMKDWGVPCYFLGVGRKRGYRWKRKDVLEALQARMVSDVPVKHKKPKNASSGGFWDQELSKIKEACAKV